MKMKPLTLMGKILTLAGIYMVYAIIMFWLFLILGIVFGFEMSMALFSMQRLIFSVIIGLPVFFVISRFTTKLPWMFLFGLMHFSAVSNAAMIAAAVLYN